MQWLNMPSLLNGFGIMSLWDTCVRRERCIITLKLLEVFRLFAIADIFLVSLYFLCCHSVLVFDDGIHFYSRSRVHRLKYVNANRTMSGVLQGISREVL